jgi:hypothetical protein
MDAGSPDQHASESVSYSIVLSSKEPPLVQAMVAVMFEILEYCRWSHSSCRPQCTNPITSLRVITLG